MAVQLHAMINPHFQTCTRLVSDAIRAATEHAPNSPKVTTPIQGISTQLPIAMPQLVAKAWITKTAEEATQKEKGAAPAF